MIYIHNQTAFRQVPLFKSLKLVSYYS